MAQQLLGTDRVIGRFGPQDGRPVLVVVSGLHGNEPSGVRASHRVADTLAADGGALQGHVIFVTGNLGALRTGARFVHRDLNRAWTRTHIERLKATGGGESSEDREQWDLLHLFNDIIVQATGPVYLLDLHTTSGEGGAFATAADTLTNRSLAMTLPVPLVLGLEELIEGTLHDYMGQRGVVSVAFEAGQHMEDEAVDRAEAAIWITLASTGLVPEPGPTAVTEARKTLLRAATGIPRVLEMRYRHPIARGDGFRMRPGYRNFQVVRKGEILAQDQDGPIRSPEAGRILMPLYQVQGNDGFFVVREFSRFWLGVSAALRHLGTDRVVHWLPGIRRHPEDPDALVVNRRVARWYALQILHLLGFRRELDVGEVLVVHRRGDGG